MVARRLYLFCAYHSATFVSVARFASRVGDAQQHIWQHTPLAPDQIWNEKLLFDAIVSHIFAISPENSTLFSRSLFSFAFFFVRRGNIFFPELLMLFLFSRILLGASLSTLVVDGSPIFFVLCFVRRFVSCFHRSGVALKGCWNPEMLELMLGR